jgi:O-antigen ligase
VLVWLAAWHMIRDHSIFGIGLDQFLYYYSPHFTSRPYWITVLNGHPTIAWREPNFAQPHNLVLDLWLSVGVLGLAALAAVIALFTRACLHLWQQGRRTPASATNAGRAALAVGAGAAMLATLVHGMVDSAYFEPDLALIFWWLVALMLLARTPVLRSPRATSARAVPAVESPRAADG